MRQIEREMKGIDLDETNWKAQEFQNYE